MPLLTGAGGTFFLLYVLEKYYELPWRNRGWAWSLVGFGVILCCIGLAVRSRPEYFLFG